MKPSSFLTQFLHRTIIFAYIFILMKRIFFLVSLFLSCYAAYSQVPGDTIVVPAIDYTMNTYGQGNRNVMVNFPNQPGITYEKILMKYNMRCKGGVVGNQVPPGGAAGCGEWDYSCNTYITDSTKTDSIKAKHASHIIPGFSGTTFNYTTQPTYNYYQYTQQQVTYTSTISEVITDMGTNNFSSSHPFHTANPNAKTQFLWRASELSNAGLTAGDITSLRLYVTNAGSAAQFLRIRMKHTTDSVLNSAKPDNAGFTEVYFLNTNLTNGMNAFNFYTPFSWNGTDHILVEFSYGNSTNGINTTVEAENTSFTSCLYNNSNDYHYEFNGANYFNLNNTNLSSFNDQISISFWCYGNPDILPTNTSICYANSASNNREVNIHLPWSNSNVYWDCGSGGPYDRIYTAATASQTEGKWNHWVFTKNSTTGIMNIFLNGSPWLSGTNKTIPILVENFKLGNSSDNSIPYFGKMDEFTLWNAELDSSTIQNWMYKNINSTHPNYANLLAYYKFNEGNGTSCYDSLTTASSMPTGPVWRAVRGKDIFKGFSEANERPRISFVQGVYTQTTTPVVVLDSIQNSPYNVYSFSTNGLVISPVDTQQYYKAGFTYVYDGITNAILDSIFYSNTGTINITQLNYYQYRPSRFQIMSFVTPYGNGLDLGGATGKTWTFDMTDFAPIMKGPRLLTMDAGGQWQEDMDIKFLMIVGTPPHDVFDIKNLWRVDAIGYGGIMANDYYEPRSVQLMPNASSYKIRSAITGHGQEGEFIPQNHYVDVNGGNHEYQWYVWKTCGDNPVYPSGGTWIYDRAGWCPGMATDLKEWTIDSLVTPGGTVTMDYGLDSAQGSSTYWVSQQLVTYGEPNFPLDAAVVDIMNPSTKVEYARTNSICANPKIVIRNTGATDLTSAKIEFWINQNTVHQSYQWTGNLKFMETDTITMPSNDALWQGLDTVNNIFYAEILNPNNGGDSYVLNNKMASPFKMPIIVPGDFYIAFRTNGAASESSYLMSTDGGDTIFYRNNMANYTVYRDTIHLGFGCYTFKVFDTDGDGISFWANSDGAGYCRFRSAVTGTIIWDMQADFGNSSTLNFTANYPLTYEEVHAHDQVNIYPNPSTGNLTIQLPQAMQEEIQTLEFYNVMGQKMKEMKSTGIKTHVDASGWPKGMYYVKAGKMVKKFVLE